MNEEINEEFMRSRKQKYRSVTHNGSRRGPWERWTREIRDWIVTAALVFAVMSLLNLFVFNVSTVIGQSMQPTLYEGEKLVINKITLSFADPGRGILSCFMIRASGLTGRNIWLSG